MSESHQIPVNTDTPRYVRNTFYMAGLNDFTQPPSQNPDSFVTLSNVKPTADGSLARRFGYSAFATGIGYAPRNIFPFTDPNVAGSTRYVTADATNAVKAVDVNGTIQNTGIFTPSGGAQNVRMVVSRGFGYFADSIVGDLWKWNGGNTGSGKSKWGIVAPTTTLTLTDPPVAAGNVTLNIGREYCTVFYNSATGHYSDLSPFVGFANPIFASKKIPITGFPTTADTQVTHWCILATSDGGGRDKLYLLKPDEQTTGYIPIAYAAGITDNMSEASLLASSVLLETDGNGIEIGVADNLPPSTTVATGYYPTKHKGRLYLSNNAAVYFSKALTDLITSTNTICGRFEECWPADNVLDVPISATENVQAMASDGETLYFGTNQAVYRLIGDPVLNGTVPEKVFDKVGVAAQETWKMVFVEGVPAGAMWLTPDFRVILSDMNTYEDVGLAIKTTLKTINATYFSKCWATYYGRGEYNFYKLHIVTGVNTEPDTTCVFDLKTHKWFLWPYAHSLSAGCYDIFPDGTVKTLMAPTGASAGAIYKTDESVITDAGTGFAVTIKTPWLDFEDPTTRKWLNEVEVLTDDTALDLTVYGASTKAQFASPVTVHTFTAPVSTLLGDLKYHLAADATKYRWYQFQFVSASGSSAATILAYLSIEYIPITRY